MITNEALGVFMLIWGMRLFPLTKLLFTFSWRIWVFTRKWKIGLRSVYTSSLVFNWMFLYFIVHNSNSLEEVWDGIILKGPAKFSGEGRLSDQGGLPTWYLLFSDDFFNFHRRGQKYCNHSCTPRTRLQHMYTYMIITRVCSTLLLKCWILDS